MNGVDCGVPYISDLADAVYSYRTPWMIVQCFAFQTGVRGHAGQTYDVYITCTDPPSHKERKLSLRASGIGVAGENPARTYAPLHLTCDYSTSLHPTISTGND